MKMSRLRSDPTLSSTTFDVMLLETARNPKAIWAGCSSTKQRNPGSNEARCDGADGWSALARVVAPPRPVPAAARGSGRRDRLPDLHASLGLGSTRAAARGNVTTSDLDSGDARRPRAVEERADYDSRSASDRSGLQRLPLKMTHFHISR